MLGAPSRTKQLKKGKQEGEEKKAERTSWRHCDPSDASYTLESPLWREGTAAQTVTSPCRASLSPRAAGNNRGRSLVAHSSVYLGHANADYEHPTQARRLQRDRRHGYHSKQGPLQTEALLNLSRFGSGSPSSRRRGRSRGVGGGVAVQEPGGRRQCRASTHARQSLREVLHRGI